MRPVRRQLSTLSLPLFVWLVVVWILLWGSVAPGTVVAGVLVSLGVLVLFPLPAVHFPVLRPVRLARLIGYVIVDLFSSALRTAVEVIRYGPRVRAAVVAVPTLSDLDHVIAAAAGAISLTPDTFVIQIDRAGGVLYVYSLGVRSREQADHAHDQALALQVRVVRAIGTADEAGRAADRADRLRRGRPVSPEKSPEAPPEEES
ncbi:Na+/H+ antiporter subunit E [Saccharomonospora iraqiensis]|uniref:Na+/H+ antiporter subunit E n=1 Tax=Saccharomonospora iraqiensis TaxID=52698 RepID=UPI00022E190D|nr:Na+/H+ antiporter subunit E [Saccharomonospora iraqiensis]